MTSKLLVVSVLICGIALGLSLNQITQNFQPSPSPPISLDTTSCQRVCYVAIKFASYVDFKIELALKLATLIPKTELACQRICSLPAIAENLAELLKESPLTATDLPPQK